MPGASDEQRFDEPAARIAEMFAVIEDQQRVLRAQRGDDEFHRRRLFGRIEFHRGGERGRNERRIFEPREIDEPHALAERADAAARGFECEPRLADAARTRERDEPNVAEQLAHFGEFAFAAEKARELQRQIVARGLTAQRRQRRSIRSPAARRRDCGRLLSPCTPLRRPASRRSSDRRRACAGTEATPTLIETRPSDEPS